MARVLQVSLFLFVWSVVSGVVSAYKPVFLLHGVGSNHQSLVRLQQSIQRLHPGTVVYNLVMFENLLSLAPLAFQVNTIAANISATVSSQPQVFSDGYHLVCHSQGALICRCVCEELDNHGVDTLVSLAGPQLGVYDNHWFSFLPPKWQNLTEQEIYLIAYSKVGQSALSIANMWNDPLHSSSFLENNAFLPHYNGLNDSDPDAARLRENFMRLQKAVFLVGQPTNPSTQFEGGIGPWISGVFGYYNTTDAELIAAAAHDDDDDDDDEENEQSDRVDERKRMSSKLASYFASPSYVPMKQQSFYVDDTFGLRSLDESGRLVIQSVLGITHGQWVSDDSIIKQYIAPHLV